MAYDTRLPLMGTGPDVLGSYVSGVSAAEKVQDMRRKKGLRDLFSEQGGAIMRGESGALEKLAQYDPQSAMGIQSTLASERRAQNQEGRAQGAYNLRMSEAERVQNQQKLQRAVSVMQGINDPAAWDAAAQQYDPSMVGRFAEKDNIINEALGLSAALERTATQQGAAAASGYFGGADEFNAGLAQTESGGRYDIVNDEGYTGKYQFGQDRLDDYNRAKGTNYTTEQLRTNPELQEGVQSWHVGDIDNYIQSNGLDQYVGRNIGGVNMSVDGMRAMAHLGGKAGMKKFLESGGEYNPADSNGTRLSDYAQTHGSKTEDPTQRLATLLQNPDVSPDVKRLAVADYEKSNAPDLPTDPSKRYRVVNDQLIDLKAEGGPKAVDVGALDLPASIDADGEQKLRKEWIGIPAVKDFSSQTDAYGRVIASAEDPSAAGDLALIFNYMKLLDPGSVVRESEFATAEQASAWLQDSEEAGVAIPRPIANAIRKTTTGQKLAPGQRKDFVGRAEKLYKEASSGYSRLEDQYKSVAEQNGYDPARTIIDFRRQEPDATKPRPSEPIVIDGYTIEVAD